MRCSRDLVQQLRQHRAVTVADGSKLCRLDVRSRGGHGQMHLAPLASALNAMLARLPFAIAEKLDPGAVNEQVQGTFGERLLRAFFVVAPKRRGPVTVVQRDNLD